jgi:hypothetical protein
MPRLLPRLAPVLSVALAAIAAFALPREARATIGGGFAGPGFSLFVYNVCSPLGGTTFLCTQAGVRVDPAGDIKHVSMTLDYDFVGPNFAFNAALSGPLDVFSVGGSAPPATPGVGVQPLTIFPVPPDTPGAALPGSVLTVVDNGLTVTLDYLLAAPINVVAEKNFFVFMFDYLVPRVIDATRTVVTYSLGILPNADFVVFDPRCESGDPLVPTCGSTEPSTSVTIDVIPEPSSAALVAAGAIALAGAAARRRTRAARHMA